MLILFGTLASHSPTVFVEPSCGVRSLCSQYDFFHIQSLPRNQIRPSHRKAENSFPFIFKTSCLVSKSIKLPPPMPIGFVMPHNAVAGSFTLVSFCVSLPLMWVNSVSTSSLWLLSRLWDGGGRWCEVNRTNCPHRNMHPKPVSTKHRFSSKHKIPHETSHAGHLCGVMWE